MAAKFDHIGHRYGRLVVSHEVEQIKPGRPRYFCACDCGGHTIVLGYLLTAGRSKSCGCLRKENMPDRRKHGDAGSNLYRIWTGIKARCYNANNEGYSRYGGRGIKLCERWLNDFSAFRADMGNRPSSNHSIDRIDVNGDYSPENCRWATPFEQSQNTRRTVFVNLDGIELCLKEACRQTGVNYSAAKWRISKGYDWKDNRNA